MDYMGFSVTVSISPRDLTSMQPASCDKKFGNAIIPCEQTLISVLLDSKEFVHMIHMKQKGF